jgi:hypothetical protein
MKALVKATNPTDVDDTVAFKKGDIVEIFNDSITPGGKMMPPKFVWVICPEITYEEAQEKMKKWVKDVDYEVVASNAQGWRVRIWATTPDGTANTLTKEEVEEFFVDENGCTIHSWGPNEVTVDIPIEKDLADLKLKFKKMMQDKTYQIRRYYFEESDVDWALSNGGIVTITRSQFISKVKDKTVV